MTEDITIIDEIPELTPEEIMMLDTLGEMDEEDPIQELTPEQKLKLKSRTEPPFPVSDDDMRIALLKTLKDKSRATWNEVLWNLPCKGETVNMNAVWFYCRTSTEFDNFGWDGVRKLSDHERECREAAKGERNDD